MGIPVAVFYVIESEDFLGCVPITLRPLSLNEQSF